MTKKMLCFISVSYTHLARLGYTNTDVAKKLGISRVSYENKKKNGKFTTLEIKSLCKLFKCKFDYLFYTDGEGEE